MMRLHKQGDCYVFESTYDERMVPKEAKFWWHGKNCYPNCKACASGVARLVWWTPDPAIAARLARHADQTCRAELEALAAGRRAKRDESRALDADVPVPAPPGLAYFPFQRAGVAAITARESALLGDEMGLGKTVQVLGLLNVEPTIRSVLVICPASVKLNWKRECERWLIHTRTVGVTKGPTWPDTEIVITNYDLLVRHHDAIRAREWDLLVADEAHYLKNQKAQRTRQVMGWRPGKKAKPEEAKKPPIPAIRAKRRLALTGTPIVNRPLELWPLISWLDPITWNPERFWRFAQRYCDAKQVRAGRDRFVWDLTGASNLPELHETLRSTILIRRLKAEVLTELPEKTVQIVELESNGAAKILKREEEEAKRVGVWDAFDGEGGDTKAIFVEMSNRRREVGMAKVPHVIEHLRDILDSGAKAICFAHHKDVVEAIRREFMDIAVTVTGDDPVEQRQKNIDRFQHDPDWRLFVGSITACAEGINLTAASHVVFAEFDWRPGVNLQAEDRAHRIGQKNAVLVQYLVFENSLDARIAKFLARKTRVIREALDTPPPAWEEPLVPKVDPSMRINMASLPSGGYAVPTEDGKIGFYRIDQSERGWWFVCLQFGPEYRRLGTVTPDGNVKGPASLVTILQKILRDPREAAIRYGKELGICSRCGQELTNEQSREAGIGPVCARKAGW